jgi:hypothetical protein
MYNNKSHGVRLLWIFVTSPMAPINNLKEGVPNAKHFSNRFDTLYVDTSLVTKIARSIGNL